MRQLVQSGAWTLPWLAIACAPLLGLNEGQPIAGCKTDLDCSPTESCENGQCASERCEVPGQTTCSGLNVKRCGEDGTWALAEEPCDAICEHGWCRRPNSCESSALCGLESCCKADVVPGGEFTLHYVYGARVMNGKAHTPSDVVRRVPAFALDRFEVTVSRFWSFVNGYGDDRRPELDDATYHEIPGSGWNESWNETPNFLPKTQLGLEDMLKNYGQVFDDDANTNLLPVRGVNWFVALAFCIWDGARLPTEAEWSFAAQGGSDPDGDRKYPWPNQGLKFGIDSEHAHYESDAPLTVGSKPNGRGRWGQEDLAGNVGEWVFDGYHEELEKAPCADEGDEDAANRWACVVLDTILGTKRVLRGGSYSDVSAQLQNVKRTEGSAELGAPTIGFRCARSLDGGK